MNTQINLLEKKAVVDYLNFAGKSTAAMVITKCGYAITKKRKFSKQDERDKKYITTDTVSILLTQALYDQVMLNVPTIVGESVEYSYSFLTSYQNPVI